MTATANSILDFWFDREVEKLWFNSNRDFDKKIQSLYEDTYQAGVDGLLKDWEESPKGVLALIILFDQFPLNMYRGNKKSFDAEAMSREIARKAIENNFDQQLTLSERSFLYMPFMHSENLEDQRASVSLFEKAGLKSNLRFAKHHQSIIQRFGRFPHRNKILGRGNTQEEEQYLNSEEAFLG